eukprot:s4511_g6.t1
MTALDSFEYMFGASFTDTLPASAEVLMVLKDTQLCQHSSYLGGDEREYHRGANGHTRHVTCKSSECDKTVISARRKNPEQLWRYLVQIALCTKWGSAARSRELFASVCRVRDAAIQEEQDRTALEPPHGYPRRSPSRAAPTSSPSGSPHSTTWEVMCGPPSTTGSEPASGPKTAKIVRAQNQEPRFWAYGIYIAPGVDPPEFPVLATEDQDVLQPLPSDQTPCGPETPYAGYTFEQVSSSPEASAFCTQTLMSAMQDQPMTPDHFRLAFYLYGRAKLLHSAVTRMWKSGQPRVSKRPQHPDEMIAHRCIRVPLCLDIHHPEVIQVHDFEVLMTEDDPNAGDRLDLDFNFAATPSDPPGLAILDPGCTRTMHGENWSKSFEAELGKLGLSSRRRLKHQSFKGVDGEIASNTVKVFPIGIGGVNGELHSAEAPGGLPLLLSRPFMEQLETVIDIGSGEVTFKKIGVTLKLIKTSKGHLAVSLLDFDLNCLDDYAESPAHHEGAQTALATEEDSPDNKPSDPIDWAHWESVLPPLDPSDPDQVHLFDLDGQILMTYWIDMQTLRCGVKRSQATSVPLLLAKSHQCHIKI